MKSWHARVNLRWAGRALAWSAFATIALLSALLVQALAVGALGEPSPAAPLTNCQPLSPTTAALADGDDVRARFLVRLAAESAPSPDRESVCGPR
jgi:hypothetical protein